MNEGSCALLLVCVSPFFFFVKLSVKYVNVLKNSHFTAYDFSVCNGISFPDFVAAAVLQCLCYDPM